MANYVSNVTIPDPDPNVDTTYTYDVKEAFPHIGTCNTAAATGTKSVTLTGFTLYTGAWLIVKFDYANTADVSTVKLDVNGTGAKSVKYRNANLGWAGQLIANRYTMFIYDGTYYQVVGDFDTDTKNTAGSTDTSSKIYLIGATSQATNPQTYSDNEVYTTSGVLTTKKTQVGGGACTLEYNTTTESLDFVFT